MVPTKRHSSNKDKSSSLSRKDKVSTVQEYGEGLVGSRIRVWWPIDRKFYEGVVESYSSSRRKHRVLYDDGDEEYLVMKREKWELIEEDEDAMAVEVSLDEQAADDTPEPKKGKSNGKSSGKRRVEDAMPNKKLKIDSSAKSKSRARSGRKAEDERQTPKPSETNGKLGDIGGKIVAAASRMSMRFQRKENGQVKQIPDDDDTSDEESETLVSFMKKLKGKKEKEVGERSSRNEEEEGSSGSEAGEESKENESGEDSSETEAEEGSETREGSEGSEGGEGSEGSEGGEGGEGSEGSEGWEEAADQSSGNETD